MAGDNDNATPEQVTAEVAELERQIAEAKKAEQPPEPQPQEPEKTEPPAETPEAAPEPVQDAPQEPEQSVEPEPSETDALRAELSAKQHELETLRQSYKVLQGKTYAEVPRIAAQNRALRADIAKRDEIIRELRSRQSVQPTTPSLQNPPEDPDNPYGLTKEERDFDPAALTAMEKIARKVVAKHQPKQPEPAEQAPVEDDGFLATLESLCPDWRVINGDRAFVDWLGDPDAGQTLPRFSVFKALEQTGDGVGVADYFNRWKASKRPTPTAAKRPSVAAQVAPKSVASASPAPKGKTYTEAEWQAGMDRLTTLQHEKPQEAAALTAELNRALVEGRVRP